jgi:hypothetical protein
MTKNIFSPYLSRNRGNLFGKRTKYTHTQKIAVYRCCIYSDAAQHKSAKIAENFRIFSALSSAVNNSCPLSFSEISSVGSISSFFFIYGGNLIVYVVIAYPITGQFGLGTVCNQCDIPVCFESFHIAGRGTTGKAFQAARKRPYYSTLPFSEPTVFFT